MEGEGGQHVQLATLRKQGSGEGGGGLFGATAGVIVSPVPSGWG